MKAKKNIIILAIIIVLLVIVILSSMLILTKKSSTNNTISYSTDIEVVPTLLDEITSNSAWCATFQLVWNDMQNDVVKKDIIFTPQITIAENLNKQTFTENDLSDDYYYKAYGLMTLALKEQIETGIKEKFNETSDLLDMLNWSDIPEDDSGYDSSISKKYLFYAMLYREFNFKNKFDVLDNNTFKGTQETYDDVEYFGIDENSSDTLYNQVDVLYYNSSDDFAVSLKTVEGDNVVLCMGNNGSNFNAIYENIQEKTENYEGNTAFTEYDTLKVPMIDLNILKRYEELESAGTDGSKIFYDYQGNECYINYAIQSIKFELDESGGKIKSESILVMTDSTTAALEEENEYRYFEFDETYSMFLVEEDKDKPYFAAYIDDITLFQ